MPKRTVRPPFPLVNLLVLLAVTALIWTAIFWFCSSPWLVLLAALLFLAVLMIIELIRPL